MGFDFSYPNSSASQRGWGPGWEPGMAIGSRPASYPGEIVPLEVAGASFPAGVRAEVHDLLVLLLEESLRRNYVPKLDSPGCWGLAFRPTKRSDGTYTTTPSNHSWGLAVDINAPHNVYGASTHQIPLEMAALWRSYGWRWLGPAIKDWQHFDFAGTPADAKAMTIKARRAFTPKEPEMTDAEREKLNAAYNFATAVKDALGANNYAGAGAQVGKVVKNADGSTDITVHIPSQDVKATVTG